MGASASLFLLEEPLLQAQQAAVVLVLAEAVPEIRIVHGFIFCSWATISFCTFRVRKMAIITGL